LIRATTLLLLASTVLAADSDNSRIGSATVNASGGIDIAGDKYPVEIIYIGDRNDPQTSTKLVEKLITEDKVDLIFGPYSSDCVGPRSTITEKCKVSMIRGRSQIFMNQIAQVRVETYVKVFQDKTFFRPRVFPERNKRSRVETWGIQTATVERLQREGLLEKRSS
jgi:hypothetical protein